MNYRILQSLRQGQPISGEELGKRLNISRTAVWKHINELRSLGYQIESSPQAGYRLIKNSELLLPEEIMPGLDTRVIGRKIAYYNEVTSTQDIAAELAKAGSADGTAVISESQTSGRGRKGRNWVSSPEGGLHLSLILKPDLAPAQVAHIPLVTGIALTRAIRQTTTLHPQIKWPNDIIINRKKAGGILTEMSSEIDRVNYIILGIGLNVNVPGSYLAPRIAGSATSLVEESGSPVSRAGLVQRFLNEFEILYHQYLASGFSSVRDDWKALSNTLNSGVKIDDGSHLIEGIALDIDENGFLIVRKADGNISRIVSGDVVYSQLEADGNN
jgi:BirA family transcriptional regulator, biotin operon repressor / biotin---[acetyl-CoA-carboxylase] ligase